MADALKALEERGAPDALKAFDVATPNALRALEQSSTSAQSTGVRLPKKPLLPTVTSIQAYDPQRNATLGERALSALTIAPSLQVGLIDAAMGRQSPQGGRMSLPESVVESVREKRNYGSLLRENLPQEINVPLPYTGYGGPSMVERNIAPALAFGGGLAADVAADPSTYTGFGALTKLGQARKTATLGEMVAKLGALGSDAARAEGVANQVGRLAPTMAEQARRGERALLSFAGKPLIRGAPVLGAAEKVVDAAKAASPGLRVAPELSGLEREAFLAREAQVRAAHRVGQREAVRVLKPIAQDLSRIARRHGVDESALRVSVMDAIERGGIDESGIDILQHLDPADAAKYRRWTMQANAAKFGFAQSQPELSAAQDVAARVASTPSPVPGIQAQAADEIERETLRRMGGPPGGFPGPAKRLESVSGETLGQRELASAGTAGRPSIFTTKRGNVQTRGGLPNLLTMEGAFTGTGRMPEEFLANLPENTIRRIKALEQSAIERARAKKIAEAIDSQLSVYGPTAASALRPGVSRAVSEINSINAANLARKQAEGIPIERLADDIEYLRRITTPEARRMIDSSAGGFAGFAKEITERHGAQQQRSFRGITTAEANELWQTGKLASNGNTVTKTKLFVDDPFVSTTLASGETERAIEASKMLRAYAAVEGRPSALAPKGWQSVGSDLPALKDVKFPPHIAKMLNKHFAPASKEAFGRAWRTLNGAWAKWTTGPFPGFHARNEFGDVWNAYVLGDADPRRLADAIPLMLGKGRSSYTLGGRTYSGDEIVDLANRLNVMDSSFMRSVVNDVNALSRPKGVVQAIDNNAATRAAEKFGQAREASNRLAMFMDGLSKGMEPAVAAERTRTFLFDYGRLPDAVGAMRSNVMPFLAWTYYNAPLQASSILRKPGAFAAVQKTREEAGGERGLGLGADNAQLPSFLRTGLPMPLGTGPSGDPVFGRLEGFWPGSDLDVFTPEGAAQRAMSLISPLITTGPEVAMNVNAFRSDFGSVPPRLEPQAPAETGPMGVPFSERGSMLGLPVPKRAIPVLELVRMITELDRMNPGGIFGNNESPNALGAQREFPDAGPGQRAASFLLGVRNYAIQPGNKEEQDQRAFERERTRLRSLHTRYLRRGDERNAELIERMIEELENNPERAAR